MQSQRQWLTLLLGAFFVSSPLTVSTAQCEINSLRAVVATLDSTSLRLNQARIEIERARATHATSRSLPNPTLFASHETINDAGNSTERVIGARQSLGFLWSRSSRMSSTRCEHEAALASYQEIRNDVAMQTTKLAFEYDRLQRQNNLMDSVLVRAGRLADATTGRRRVGDIAPYDEQRFQLEMVQLMSRKQEFQSEASSVLLELVQVTGLPPEVFRSITLSMPPSLEFSSEEEAVQYAMGHRPELFRAERQVDVGKNAFAQARWNQLPDFTIGVGQKSLDPGPGGLVVEGELEIPLWNQRRSETRIARAGLKHAEVQYTSLKRSVEEEVRGAYRTLRLTEQLQPNVQANPADSARVNMLRGVQLYAEGEMSAFELVDALRTSVEAQDAVLSLRNSLAIARAEFRRAVGLNPLEEN